MLGISQSMGAHKARQAMRPKSVGRTVNWCSARASFATKWVLLLVFGCGDVAAQDGLMGQATKNKYEDAIAPLTEHDFGDRIDQFTLSTELQNTDVSIPGNFDLPVAVGRKMPAGRLDIQVINGYRLYRFGNWDLDIPYMYGLYGAEKPWHAKTGDALKRCSTATPEPPNIASGNIFGFEYWNGNYVYVPGEYSGMVLLATTPVSQRPQQSSAYRWTTTGNWYFSCLPTLAHGEGEGFLALSPKGDKYYFNYLVRVGHGSATIPGVASASINNVKLYPTRIEDRFGNAVNYVWSGDTLIEVNSTDGRKIQIFYTNIAGTARITSIVAEGRTWVYQYNGDAILQKVILPDQTFWQYQTPPFYSDTYVYPNYSAADGCDVNLFGTKSFTYTVTHPSGAKADMTFTESKRGRSLIQPKCVWNSLLLRDNNKSVAKHFYVVAMTQKRVYGPGIPDRVWQFSSGSSGSWHDCTGNCPTTSTTTITEPGVRVTKLVYGTHHAVTEGFLLKRTIASPDGTILLDQDYSYDFPSISPSPPYARQPGNSSYYVGYNPLLEKVIPLRSVSTNVHGTTFNWSVLQFDHRARPLSVLKSSSPNGHSRQDDVIYYDDETNWVLGQQQRVLVDTIEAQRTEFGWKATPTRVYEFGRLASENAYEQAAAHQLGALRSITDGRGKTTTFNDWYRGVARQVGFPDGTSVIKEVNGLGWTTSYRDEIGAKTCYEYDAVGRMTRVIYPSESAINICDTSSWNDTTRTFEKLLSSDGYGSAGLWKQTESTGDFRKITYLNGMWKPVLQRAYDNSAVSSTQTNIVQEYDVSGRLAFTSYPSDSPISTTGTWTIYDALDRVRVTAVDSEQGRLETRTDYVSGLKTATTQPDGSVTTTLYQAYEVPDYSLPILVQEPEGRETHIGRDHFGKPVLIERK